MTEPTFGLDSLIGSCEGLACAIVGTGTSLEGFDLSQIQDVEDGKVWTIGMNEAVKLLVPDYAVVCDTRAFRKSWEHYNPKTTLVMGERCWKATKHRADFNPHTGRDAHQKVLSLPNVYVAKYTHEIDPLEATRRLFWQGAIVTAALSLAVALGFRRAYLYGVDFYRMLDRAYAYNLGTKAPENTETTEHEGLYLTPAFRSMRDSVRNNLQVWEGLEVVNMSRFSQLDTFPIDHERGLPR